MPLRMWMMDLAREQWARDDVLDAACRLSLESGYDALGLYLEHRFAYPSTPWAHGEGALQPEQVRRLEREFPDLKLVPFINLLGHMEGFLYTEHGSQYAESRFQGMQACPSKPETRALAIALIDGTLGAFSSELVHIGGDETWQLGACPDCAARVAESEAEGRDGKAQLFGNHFGLMAEIVQTKGRRPAIWGDMLETHPEAMAHLPPETLIFDWKYFSGLAESAPKFMKAGFEVVGCPTLHTYNAAWLHVEGSESNVRQVVADSAELGLAGVCVTTWECALFGAYPTLFPALRACGRHLNGGLLDLLGAYADAGERWAEWARLMGVELERLGGSFAFTKIRSSLKVRLLLMANPFLAWLHHREEFTGDIGRQAHAIAVRAAQVAPDPATRAISEFVQLGIEFVQTVESARTDYAAGRPGESSTKLAVCRQHVQHLERLAFGLHTAHGGSKADIERCRIALEHVERVMRRIRAYGDGSLGYLPAFEHLCHPRFTPHDQGAWWLINRWAHE